VRIALFFVGDWSELFLFSINSGSFRVGSNHGWRYWKFERELYRSDAGGITCNCHDAFGRVAAGVLGTFAAQICGLCLQGPIVGTSLLKNGNLTLVPRAFSPIVLVDIATQFSSLHLISQFSLHLIPRFSLHLIPQFSLHLIAPIYLSKPNPTMQLSSNAKRLKRAARIILVGAPGVGKGTQSDRLISRFPQLASISTGDLLRNHVKNKTALGKSTT